MSGAEMQESSLLQPDLHGASTGIVRMAVPRFVDFPLEKRTRTGSNFRHGRDTKLSITVHLARPELT